MSDMVVNALVQYIVPNQPVPDWVWQLPEPIRSQKIGTGSTTMIVILSHYKEEVF